MANKRLGTSGVQAGHADATHEAAAQATKQDPESLAKRYPKTYRLRRSTIEAVDKTAAEKNIDIRDFVDWALIYVIDGVKAGSIEIPTETTEVKRVILD